MLNEEQKKWSLLVDPNDTDGFGTIFGPGHKKRFTERIKRIEADPFALLK